MHEEFFFGPPPPPPSIAGIFVVPRGPKTGMCRQGWGGGQSKGGGEIIEKSVVNKERNIDRGRMKRKKEGIPWWSRG